MNKKPLQEGLVDTLFHYDEADGTTWLERVQDVEPILNETKAAFNDAPEFGRYKRDVVKVASIPLVVYEAYLKKGIDLLKDDAALRRFLNDPDNRAFRTTPGKV